MLTFSFKRNNIIILAIWLIVIISLVVGIVMICVKRQEKIEEEENNSFPVIQLQKDNSSGSVEEVTINVSVSTDSKKGIAYVVTPDGEKKEKDGESYVRFAYKVTENGNYSFSACDANGNISEESIEITNIKKNISDNPYLPEGFEYVDGDVGTGYVIEDSYGNQYVWIPVDNGNLSRSKQYETKYSDEESCVIEFKNSVAKYCGFYIARYEASVVSKNDTQIAYSIINRTPTTNLTYQDAFRIARENYINLKYTDCITSLVNSYAIDTALEWINKTNQDYSSSDQFGNYSGYIKNTGETLTDEVNRICDLAGNVREWTTEYDNSSAEEVKKRIVRGGSAVTDRTAGSYTLMSEDSCDEFLGFRTLLYK